MYKQSSGFWNFSHGKLVEGTYMSMEHNASHYISIVVLLKNWSHREDIKLKQYINRKQVLIQLKKNH